MISDAVLQACHNYLVSDCMLYHYIPSLQQIRDSTLQYTLASSGFTFIQLSCFYPLWGPCVLTHSLIEWYNLHRALLSACISTMSRIHLIIQVEMGGLVYLPSQLTVFQTFVVLLLKLQRTTSLVEKIPHTVLVSLSGLLYVLYAKFSKSGRYSWPGGGGGGGGARGQQDNYVACNVNRYHLRVLYICVHMYLLTQYWCMYSIIHVSCVLVHVLVDFFLFFILVYCSWNICWLYLSAWSYRSSSRWQGVYSCECFQKCLQFDASLLFCSKSIQHRLIRSRWTWRVRFWPAVLMIARCASNIHWTILVYLIIYEADIFHMCIRCSCL